MATRVYKYGLLEPVENGHLVSEQIRAAHRYYNDLIALERERRGAYREARARLAGDVAPLEAKVQALGEELEGMRQRIRAVRKRAQANAPTPTGNAIATELRQKLKAARAELKAAREAAKDSPALQAFNKELVEKMNAKEKALRASCGCWWGTYSAIEDAVDAAKKSPVDPRFRRWNGNGRIAAHVQGGLTTAELLAGENTRLRLTGTEQADRKGRPYVTGKAHARAVVKGPVFAIRIGSAPDRTPIWGVFPAIYHRPLPEHAQVKRASVHRERIGTTDRWTVSITVTMPDEDTPIAPAGRVALNFGWRMRGERNIRAAYWVGSDGARGEILMPARIRERVEHSRSLRSIQDRNFDAIRLRLMTWLGEHAGKVPEWLREQTQTLERWRSPARLTMLVHAWRENRVEGDGDIYDELEAWRKQQRHLYQWESHERTRALGHRREVYRIAAAMLTRRYGMLLIDAQDIGTVRRHKPAEKHDEEAPRAQRSQLFDAAPGELRLALKAAASARGCTALDVPADTAHCHACGGVCTWDRETELEHACEHCGAIWDQDENACENMLAGTRDPKPKKVYTPRVRRKKPAENALADADSR